MSPTAQKIIDDLKLHMEKAFDDLTSLVQEEAVNEMIAKLTPTTAKVRLTRTKVSVQLDTPKEDPEGVSKAAVEKELPAPVQPVDPFADPNYGMLGSACYSEGNRGAVVTTVAGEDEED